MSEYEALREDMAELGKAIVGYQSATTRQLLEQSRQIGKLWTDNGALRDELHAVANRLENLTTFVTTAPAEVAAAIVNDANRSTTFVTTPPAEVAAAIVNDANRSTLREVRGDDAK